MATVTHRSRDAKGTRPRPGRKDRARRAFALARLADDSLPRDELAAAVRREFPEKSAAWEARWAGQAVAGLLAAGLITADEDGRLWLTARGWQVLDMLDGRR